MTEIKKNSNSFWIYILECENGNFYTGYTKDLAKRYQQHEKGTASSKYTRSFKPKRIAQCWQLIDDVGVALKIERFIKKQNRKTKQSLIDQPAKLSSLLVEEFDLKPKIYPVNPLKIK